MAEAINHPNHYKASSGIEVIDVIESMGMGWGFCIGNAIKYIARAGAKVPADKTQTQATIEDLKKALWYLERASNDNGPRTIMQGISTTNIANAWGETLTYRRMHALQHIAYIGCGGDVATNLNEVICTIQDEIAALTNEAAL